MFFFVFCFFFGGKTASLYKGIYIRGDYNSTEFGRSFESVYTVRLVYSGCVYKVSYRLLFTSLNKMCIIIIIIGIAINSNYNPPEKCDFSF